MARHDKTNRTRKWSRSRECGNEILRQISSLAFPPPTFPSEPGTLSSS
jgi:hypothetical protein